MTGGTGPSRRTGRHALTAARGRATRLRALLGRRGGGAPGGEEGPSRAPEAGDGGVDLPPTPLPCPKGAHTGPPDFVGVGMQRCGTTRWFRLLIAHPEIAAAQGALPGHWSETVKELHYFDRFYASACEEGDISRYQEYFPRAEGQKAGEWTPLYASAPWVPPLLAAAAPAARLLVIVRDPLERLVSALALAERVAERQGKRPSRYAPLDALWRGFYHAQLEHLLAYFDRSQLLVLQFERCARDPLGELRRTLEFIGVRDTEFVPDELDTVFRGEPAKPALDPARRDAYVRAYSADVVRLIAAFPEIDVSLWPNFAHLADGSSPRG